MQRKAPESAGDPAETAPTLTVSLDGVFGQAMLYVENVLALSGAARAPAPIEDVRIEVEGAVFHAARGLPRPDHEDFDGFDFRLDTSGWEPGPRRVRVVARDRTGREAATEGDIDLRPFEPPAYTDQDRRRAIADGRTVVWCERPRLDVASHVGSPLRVSGWAWCAAGVREVTVGVDGVTRVPALTGLPSPHLQDSLGDEVAEAGGFSAVLDSEELAPGWHTLTVVAVGADGRAVGIAGPVEVSAAGSAAGVELEAEPDISPSLIADRYVPEFHIGFSFEPEHYARYHWAAAMASGRRALDAGCGTGFGAEMLARAGAEQVDAFDISLEAVEHARRRAGRLVDFVEGDLLRIPFPAGHADLVTCFEALEHVPDPQRALDELKRVLAPGGVLLVSTPNRGVYRRRQPPPPERAHLGGVRRRAPGALCQCVSVMRQQTYATALIVKDATFAISDADLRLLLDLRKLVGGKPGEELYMVAAASDAKLPELPELAVIGAAVDLAARVREIKAWKARAVRAEEAAAAARVEASRAAADVKRLAAEIERARGERDDALDQLAADRVEHPT